jgi:hypothetical protein
VRVNPLRLLPSLADLSAENIALLVAVGLVVGIFPVYGCPTILCLLASLLLRVNFPALQAVNQFAWPLQIAMLVPLTRLGSRIVAPSAVGITLAGRLGIATLQAVVGWLCICVPLWLLLYLALKSIVRRNRNQGLRLPIINTTELGSPIC